ncbi:DUF3626 domain-containing protein [Streptomyces wuyuanensis]|uniref:DUF3626 domain-containing protein n=1 Tax=Streptomyces wuyuanensis TaxID=1196353 RepID=UPI00344330DE
MCPVRKYTLADISPQHAQGSRITYRHPAQKFATAPHTRHLDSVEEIRQRLQLTPSQAWALVHAAHKSPPIAGDQTGTGNRDDLRAAVLERIPKGRPVPRGKAAYTLEDVDKAVEYVKKAPITINMQFDRPIAGRTLADVLCQAPGLKNQWETGTTGASSNLSQRAYVESWLGYASALPEGQPQIPAELPVYGALNILDSPYGGAPDVRYGKSHLVLKESVRDRATLTPTDSFSGSSDTARTVMETAMSASRRGATTEADRNSFEDAVQHVTARESVSALDPISILASQRLPMSLLKAIAAAATGKQPQTLALLKQVGDDPEHSSYIEAQIHGGVRWDDVAEIVIDRRERDAEQILQKFQDLACQYPDLVVRYAK